MNIIHQREEPNHLNNFGRASSVTKLSKDNESSDKNLNRDLGHLDNSSVQFQKLNKSQSTDSINLQNQQQGLNSEKNLSKSYPDREMEEPSGFNFVGIVKNKQKDQNKVELEVKTTNLTIESRESKKRTRNNVKAISKLISLTNQGDDSSKNARIQS